MLPTLPSRHERPGESRLNISARGKGQCVCHVRSMFNQKYLSYNLFLHAVQKQQVRSWQGILQISLLVGALGVGRSSPDTCVSRVFGLAHAKLSSLRVGLDSIVSTGVP